MIGRRSKSIFRRCAGFTLYELLLSFAISAIVLTVAVPNVSETIHQNALTSNINYLVGSLRLARSEAVSRNANVIVCRSANANTANPGCATGASTWGDGWLVFVNSDNDSPAVRDAGEVVLKVWSGLSAGYALDSSAIFDDAIGFNATGDVGSIGEFVLCKDADLTKARSLNIDRTGNVSVSSRSTGGVLTRRDGSTVASCAAI